VVGVGTFRPEDHETWTDDVTRLVEGRGLPHLRGRRFRTRRALDDLKALRPDILFAIGWRWILPRTVLDLPPKGCLGIHGSLLPRGRGFAPVNWALLRDEPRTGPSLFYFDEGTDTGDLVGQRPFELTDEDDAATVRQRLMEASVELLDEHLPGLADGTAPRIVQPSEGATYGPRRRPEDGLLDWTASPREVFNWVRGLTRPYPGAFSFLGGREVAIWRVRPGDERGRGPGLFLPGDGPLRVGAGVGCVELLDAAFRGDEEPGALSRVASALLQHGGFDPPAEGPGPL
jgi:methionyl-tRNA formyltransferase